MQIELTPLAKSHLLFWRETGNKPILRKIEQIVASIIEDPYKGIGKPEPLKHQLAGKWSRRINKEHRLIYAVSEHTLFIFSMKGHY